MHRDSILALGFEQDQRDLSLRRIGFSVARLTNQDHRQAAKASLTHIRALTIIAVLNSALFGDR